MRIAQHLIFAASLAAVPAVAAAQTAQITVDVNGSPVTFDQPPVERAGRVYVPLRGVFERLGASVVFENGTINATEGPHRISLQLGQTTATVDGQPQQLDSPPFEIAGRTLVPLRFISQALGASVDYDQNSQTVSVTLQPPQQPVAVTPPAQPQEPAAPLAIELLRRQPPPQATVATLRPELGATFGQPVDPNSVHVELDGRDVTQQTYVSDRSFVYDPGYDLPAGDHRIVVAGRTADHEKFEQSWTFGTTGDVAQNYINGLEPPNGTPARTAFTVSGYTRPNAEVTVVAATSQTLQNFSEVAQGSIAAHGTADPSGFFSVRVELPGPSENPVDVRITSHAPDGSTSVKTLRLNP